MNMRAGCVQVLHGHTDDVDQIHVNDIMGGKVVSRVCCYVMNLGTVEVTDAATVPTIRLSPRASSTLLGNVAFNVIDALVLIQRIEEDIDYVLKGRFGWRARFKWEIESDIACSPFVC